MSDLEDLKALLTRFGVGFTESKHREKKKDIYQVICEQGADKVGGYMCFVTVFEFDAEGKFIEMGAWE